jgi:hypothetical protein
MRNGAIRIEFDRLTVLPNGTVVFAFGDAGGNNGSLV